MPIDKHGKKEKEENSDYSPSEESEEEEAEEVEEEEEKTSNQESNDDEEEIPTTSKFIKPRKKLKAVTTEQKNRSPKQTKKEKKEVTIKEPKKVIIRKRTKDAIADEEELEMEDVSLKVAIIQPRKPGDDKKTKEKKSTKKDENKEEEDKDDGRKHWDNRNIDYNLYNESPDNIKIVRILLSSTVTLESKMIEASADKKGLTYDMAALVFARKTRGNKSFEFNLPMTLAPSIREGLDRIMEKNANFYAKRCLTQANASKRD